MAKHKIEDLRDLLFVTMQRLMDKDDVLDVQDAQAIANVAKVVVDSAKVEVEFMKASGGNLGSGFIVVDAKQLKSGG